MEYTKALGLFLDEMTPIERLTGVLLLAYSEKNPFPGLLFCPVQNFPGLGA